MLAMWTSSLQAATHIEGDDRGPKLWSHVSTVLASMNEFGEGSNGLLHPTQSDNTNGERLIGACTTHNLTFVKHGTPVKEERNTGWTASLCLGRCWRKSRSDNPVEGCEKPLWLKPFQAFHCNSVSLRGLSEFWFFHVSLSQTHSWMGHAETKMATVGAMRMGESFQRASPNSGRQ